MRRTDRTTNVLLAILLGLVFVLADAVQAQCPDADGDGHQDVACGGDDCDDDDSNRFPGNTEVCDPLDHDEDCNISTYGATDADGDGFVDGDCCNLPNLGDPVCGPDCNDARADTHPGASEVCNHNDDDCDGETDENPTSMQSMAYTDGDGDGWGQGVGTSLCPWEILNSGKSPLTGDCDDSEPSINPEAAEACNGVDDDCDGSIDEGFSSACGS